MVRNKLHTLKWSRPDLSSALEKNFFTRKSLYLVGFSSDTSSFTGRRALEEQQNRRKKMPRKFSVQHGWPALDDRRFWTCRLILSKLKQERKLGILKLRNWGCVEAPTCLVVVFVSDTYDTRTDKANDLSIKLCYIYTAGTHSVLI